MLNYLLTVYYFTATLNRPNLSKSVNTTNCKHTHKLLRKIFTVIP